MTSPMIPEVGVLSAQTPKDRGCSIPTEGGNGLRRNVVTPEGQFLGSKFADWCDDAEPKARLIAPDLPPRCYSCAARKGPHLANGSPDTQMLFIDCVMSGEPFYCHDHRRPDQICSGWAMFALAKKADAAVATEGQGFAVTSEDAPQIPQP